MKFRATAITAVFLLGCAREAALEWHAAEFAGDPCGDCAQVSVTIPTASEDSALGRTVNTGIREEIIDWLDYTDADNPPDIPGAIRAFEQAYRAARQAFPEEQTPWEAAVEGRVAYAGPDWISVRLEGHIFTGGAHGFTRVRYLLFDRNIPAETEPATLFRDTPGFTALAETAFREANGIPSDAGINSTGFMFEEGAFALPETIGLEEEGVMLLYNPYEIASYAEGPIALLIPWEKALPFLDRHTSATE